MTKGQIKTRTHRNSGWYTSSYAILHSETTPVPSSLQPQWNGSAGNMVMRLPSSIPCPCRALQPLKRKLRGLTPTCEAQVFTDILRKRREHCWILEDTLLNHARREISQGVGSECGRPRPGNAGLQKPWQECSKCWWHNMPPRLRGGFGWQNAAWGLAVAVAVAMLS